MFIKLFFQNKAFMTMTMTMTQHTGGQRERVVGIQDQGSGSHLNI